MKGLHAPRVLDLGAGNGKLCSELFRACHQVVSVEYDIPGFELARANYPHIPLYNQGVQDEPAIVLAKKQPVDAAISTEVIKHLYAPHQLPIYAGGLLREKGYLLLTTPYHGYS